VHPAFQIEPELELLVHQPARRVHAVPVREDWIDADRAEHQQNRDDGDQSPANFAHDALLSEDTSTHHD
jgi:hypothetical protein